MGAARSASFRNVSKRNVLKPLPGAQLRHHPLRIVSQHAHEPEDVAEGELQAT
jgi:hypothetical protein